MVKFAGHGGLLLGMSAPSVPATGRRLRSGWPLGDSGDLPGQGSAVVVAAPCATADGHPERLARRLGRTSVDINAPAAVVWAVLSDVEAMPQWTKSMSNVRREDSGTSLWAPAVVTQPRLGTGRWTVTVCTPLRSFAWVVSRPGITTAGIHLLEPTQDGVQVTLTVEQSRAPGSSRGDAHLTNDTSLHPGGGRWPQGSRREGLAASPRAEFATRRVPLDKGLDEAP